MIYLLICSLIFVVIDINTAGSLLSYFFYFCQSRAVFELYLVIIDYPQVLKTNGRLFWEIFLTFDILQGSWFPVDLKAFGILKYSATILTYLYSSLFCIPGQRCLFFITLFFINSLSFSDRLTENKNPIYT